MDLDFTEMAQQTAAVGLLAGLLLLAANTNAFLTAFGNADVRSRTGPTRK